nr:mitochondrial K+-H+ exchange-related protein [uncultured bacterium]
MLAEAERERREARASEPPAAPSDKGLMHRIKTRSMRWVAESIAEQRLLWHLRRQTAATLYYPDDLDEARALASLRSQLTYDYERHRRWLVIDAVLFLLSGLLTLVPGPNVIAYYFAFRLVGHYLSMRGARQGLTGFTWRTEKSPLLSELRRAINLEPSARERHVLDVALRLRLEHLPTFFERMAVTS